ncbi:MAG: hypothetical protein NTW82_14010 [Bacteroidia bacterium]|nr:hypothetical protein [Bacteroidia bacterium]
MAYGLKYELLCTSKLGNAYKLKLLFDGYEGSEVDRNVPASPFILKKDSAAVINGTSLQFSIREEVDFELLEFYTGNSKHIKAELYKSTTMIWTGYVLSQQYQAPYVPASRKPAITFTAADGLGILKNEEFTLTGNKSQLEIIMHCIDKIGLGLGYSIAIDLYEEHHNETYSPLAQTYEDASIYEEFNCYEVLEKMLEKYYAEISQCNCRWRIVSKTDKKSIPKLYTYAGVYESAGSTPTVLDLGYPDVSGTDVWPIGSLQHGIQSGGKKVKISHDFGLKPSFLSNYNFLNYSGSAFESWTKSGSFDILQKWLNGKPYAFLDGYSNVYTDYIQQSIQLVNTSGDDFVVEFEFAPIARVVHGPGDITGIVDTNVEVLVYIWDGGTGYRYLTKTGWSTDFGHLEEAVCSSISQPTWNKLRVFTSELPFASCTLFVRLFRLHSSGPLENQTLTGMAYSNIWCYPLHLNENYPSKIEVTASFDNSTESLKLSDIDVFTADAPDYDNAGFMYKNITKLSDGTPTQ